MVSYARALKDLFVGAIIGIAAMLPGISGAILAVCFGIYERLVRDIAEIRVYLKKDFAFLALLIVGFAVGTIITAKLLSDLIDAYPAESTMLFIGLIIGQVPAIYYLAAPKGSGQLTKSNTLALIIGMIIMGSMIIVDVFMGDTEDIIVGHDLTGAVIMFGVGLIVAVSALMPGISHSTILLVFGLMGAFLTAVSDLDMFLLIPLMLGVVVGALLFSKVVNKALEEHHRTTMFLILGLMIGSIASLLFNTFKDFADMASADILAHALGCVLAFVIGIAVSIWFMKLSAKSEFKESEQLAERN